MLGGGKLVLPVHQLKKVENPCTTSRVEKRGMKKETPAVLFLSPPSPRIMITPSSGVEMKGGGG